MPDQILLQLFLFAASTAYQISQNNKMKREADKRKGFAVTVSGEAASIPVVYGKAVLGGIETKHKVTNSFNYATGISDGTFVKDFASTTRPGSKNEYLHVQYALATEGIEGVQWVKVNGLHYNSSIEKFKHFIRTFNTGGTADPIATVNIGEANNKFTNTSWASATFQLNRDDYNYNGVPQMEFLVKGRKVRWIQESNGVYTLSTEYIYSNNPALCLLDYLTNVKFGRGLTVDEIDLESFYHAAEICDTIVATDRITAGKVNGQKVVNTVADLGSRPTDLEKHTYENELWYTTATSQYWYWNKTAWVETTYDTTRPIPLYECNITLDTSEKIRDNVERIMSTMGLAELTWSSEGKYKLLLEHPDTLEATRALVDSNHYFTDDDIVRDQINIPWPEASSRLNRATVSFLNEHEDFKEDSISWPPVNSTIHNQYLTEDNNQPFESELNLEGVTDPYHALAMAEQAVRKARTIFMLDITVSKKGLSLEPGDFINVTSDLTDISNEVFRVQSIEVNSDFTVKLSCYKYDHTALAWNVDDDIAYTATPEYDFTVPSVTNLSYLSGKAAHDLLQLGSLSWDDLENDGSMTYEVLSKKNSDSDYVALGSTRVKSFPIFTIPGTETTSNFDFAVITKSPLGRKSDPTYIIDQELIQAPEDIDSMSHVEEQYITSVAAGVKNRVRLSFIPSSSGVAVSYFTVEYKLSTDSVFENKGTTSSVVFTFDDLKAGTYDFKVTPYSSQGKAGNPFEQSFEVVGYSAVPANPTGLFGNSNQGQMSLSWTLPTDLDVLYGGKVQIRAHSKTDSNATWQSARLLVESLSGNTNNKTVPLLNGTYMIKFYDSFGNESVDAGTLVVVDSITGYTGVSTFTEETSTTHTGHQIDTGWNGTVTGGTISAGVIDLDTGSTQFTYESSDTNNSVFNWGATPTIMRLIYDFDATAVIRSGNFGDIANVSLIESIAGDHADSELRVFLSTTQDDPLSAGATWSPYRQATIGDVLARGLRYKVVCSVESVNEFIQLSNFSISLNKVKSQSTGETTSSNSSDTTVNFTTPFFDRTIYTGNANSPDLEPITNLQVIGGSQGDEAILVSRGPTGFVYSVYNGGSRVVRNVDYQAIGL